MCKALYPKIEDERTFVRYDFNGLDENPEYKGAVRAIRLLGYPIIGKYFTNGYWKRE